MFAFLRASPLRRHASFNRLWAAQALSAFGNRITRTALPVIAVLVLAAGPAETAVLAALSIAPMFVAGLLGGGFVERSNKLLLMVMLDLARFAIVAVVPVAWALGLLSFPLLCTVAVTAGLASALFANADVSILPRIVGKDQLVEANSRIQATESIAELTGPGMAGVLIDLLSAPFAMLADAATFLWSAFWLRRIPKETGEPAAEAKTEQSPREPALTTLRRDISVGLRAIMSRPPLRAILFAMMVFYLSGGVFGALYTIFMLRELGMSPAVMGAIISVGGASALVGSVAARPLAKRIGFGPALVTSFAVAIAGILMLIPAANAGPWAWVFMLGQQLLCDSGFMMFTILAISLQQKLLPEDEIARANGLNQAAAGFGMTASILATGAIAEVIGVTETVIYGAAISVLGVAPLLTRHLLAIREEPKGELVAAS